MLLFGDIKEIVRGRVIDADDLLDDNWFALNVWDAYAHVISVTGGAWLNESGAFTTTSGTAEYALASNVLVVKRMVDTTNRKIVFRVPERDEAVVDPDRSGSGNTFGYFQTATRSVQYLPTAASTITAVSSSAADDGTDFTVRLRGFTSTGLEMPETLTLDGTTPVSSATSFATFEVSKGAATTGSITIKSNAGAVTNVVLAPDDLQRKFPWIRLTYEPSAACAMRYDYLKKPLNVSADSDAFDVPEFFEELITLRFEEMARRYYGDDTKADNTLQRSIAIAEKRMKFLGRKPDEFVRWGGGAVHTSRSLNDLIGFKDFR